MFIYDAVPFVDTTTTRYVKARTPAVKPAPPVHTSAWSQFVAWFREHFPEAHAHVATTAPHALHGLGDTAQPAPAPAAAPWWQTLISTAAQALPLYQQQQLFKMQVQRAAQGLPPINVQDIAPPGVPVKVGIDKNLVMLGLGGLAIIGGGLFLLGRKRHG